MINCSLWVDGEALIYCCDYLFYLRFPMSNNMMTKTTSSRFPIREIARITGVDILIPSP